MQRKAIIGTRAGTSRRRAIICQLLIALLILVVLEAGARVAFTFYAVGAASGVLHEFVAVPDQGWDRRPNFNGDDACGVRRSFDARGLFSRDGARLEGKQPGRHRAIFLGDSNTYGYCLATESSFVEVAQGLLPEFDLINLGVPGHTSYQGYRQLLKYGNLIKPDIIFIAFNFNDRRYVVSDDAVDGDAAFIKLVRTPTQQMLEHSYLFRIVKDFGPKIGFVKHPLNATRRLRADRLKPRVDPKTYRANLVEMVGWARKHQASPYFILMGDSPNQTALLRRGIDRYARKEYSAAIEDLTLVASRSKSFFGVLARQYLSLAYKEAGSPDRAERALVIEHPLPWSHGGELVALDVDYNKIMRDVSQEYDVPLVDAKSRLDANPRVYFDFCHFDAEGHKIVGELIADVLAKAGSKKHEG
jgi:lysophospholipase L1-like esterase